MQALLDIFTTIAKPFDKGSGEKEQAILDLLSEYNPYYQENVGIVVPSVGPRKIVVVSHIDLIRKFNKGFKEDNTFVIDQDKGIISGALDNTVTNAALILAIKDLNSRNLAQNIEFVFTEGEEIGLLGMKEYMKINKDYAEDIFFINLDVTNDNWGCPASVEYDKPSFEIAKRVRLALPDCGISKNRDGDDMCAILKHGGHGFSYCLPTKDVIHSYSNYARLEDLVPYCQGLVTLLEKVSFENFKHDKFSLSIEAALEFSSIKKMKKAAKKAEKRREKEDRKYRKRFPSNRSRRRETKSLNLSDIGDIPVDDSGNFIDDGSYDNVKDLPLHFEEMDTEEAALSKFEAIDYDFYELEEVEDEDRERLEADLNELFEEEKEALISDLTTHIYEWIDEEQLVDFFVSFFYERNEEDDYFGEEYFYNYILNSQIKKKKMTEALALASFTLLSLIRLGMIDCEKGKFSFPKTEKPFFEYY